MNAWVSRRMSTTVMDEGGSERHGKAVRRRRSPETAARTHRVVRKRGKKIAPSPLYDARTHFPVQPTAMPGSFSSATVPFSRPSLSLVPLAAASAAKPRAHAYFPYRFFRSRSVFSWRAAHHLLQARDMMCAKRRPAHTRRQTHAGVETDNYCSSPDAVFPLVKIVLLCFTA